MNNANRRMMNSQLSNLATSDNYYNNEIADPDIQT